ncbi:MAG: hypothetical protein AB7G87_01180 [Clostridia bacterium]
MLKIIFRVWAILTLISFFLGIAFFANLTYSLLVPSLEGTGITFTDFFKKDLDPEKAKKLEGNLSIQSENLAHETSESFRQLLRGLFQYTDYSSMPEIEYPYPETDEVFKMIEETSQQGLQQGLKEAKDAEAIYDQVRKETLSK